MRRPKKPAGAARGARTQPFPEEQALARIQDVLARQVGAPPEGELWMGDDAALVGVRGRAVLFSVDAVVGGVHVDLSVTGVDDVGWKAVTAAISDVAAMGGAPLCCAVTVCVPPGTDIELLTRGEAEAARAYACPIVGGDLSVARQLVVTVSVIGTLEEVPLAHALPASARSGATSRTGAVTRTGAKPGDQIMVTGPCGSSAAGLRCLRQRDRAGRDVGAEPCATSLPHDVVQVLEQAHRRPVALVPEGWVARQAGVSSMIDVSDGLALDLDRVARASGVGIRLFTVPVAPGATEQEALGGGEDYELIMTTADPESLMVAFETAGLRAPIRIGSCVAQPAERSLRGEPLAISGWQHPL